MANSSIDPAGSPASVDGVSTDAPKLSPALMPGWTGADHWQALELAKPGRDEPFYINRLARAFLLVVHDLRAERSRLRSLSEENARLTAALRLGIEIIESANFGAFTNGVTDSTGTIDEGDVLTSRALDSLQAALAVRSVSTAPGEEK